MLVADQLELPERHAKPPHPPHDQRRQRDAGLSGEDGEDVQGPSFAEGFDEGAHPVVGEEGMADAGALDQIVPDGLEREERFAAGDGVDAEIGREPRSLVRVRSQSDGTRSPDDGLRAPESQVAQAPGDGQPVSRAREARRVVAGDVGAQRGAPELVQPVADELARRREDLAAAKIGARVAVVAVGLARTEAEIHVELGNVPAAERDPGGAGEAPLGIDGEEAEVAGEKAVAHHRRPLRPPPFAEQIRVGRRRHAQLEARRRLRARHGDREVHLEEGDAPRPDEGRGQPTERSTEKMAHVTRGSW